MLPIYVLTRDLSHFGDVTDEQIRLAFGSRAVILTDPADIPWDSLKESGALYIFAKENSILQKDGTRWNWITPEREKALYDYVQAGGGVLFLHNGLVGFPEDSLWHKMAGGLFVWHPMIQPVTYKPLSAPHPITEGVEPFTGEDEHYFCRLRLDELDFFMGSSSPEKGSTLAGWCHELGKGRAAAITPGHTRHIVNQKPLIRLLRNAAKWLTGEDFNGNDL